MAPTISLKTKIATNATIRRPSALAINEPFLLPMRANVLRAGQGDLIVGALEVREALGASDLAILEAQAREPVAPHCSIAAAGRRDQGEAAHRKPGGSDGASRDAVHDTNSAVPSGLRTWP